VHEEQRSGWFPIEEVVGPKSQGSEIAMLEAHDVAEAKNRGIPQFAATLRQRLGKDRMELWFGPQVGWQVAPERKLQILVSSTFLSECILRMFREDLRSVVSEVFGDGWGFELQVTPLAPQEGGTLGHSPENSAGNTAPSDRKPGRIAYDKDLVETSPLPSSICASVNAIPVTNAKVPVPMSDDNPAVVPVSAGPLRLVRSERTDSDILQESASEGSNQADREIDRLVAMRRQQERRWDEFIVGSHNQFAWTACQMVLERPGQISPLLIHGPHGVGKTHLAVGLSQRLKALHRYRRVLLLTGEQFTIEYTENAKSGGFASFRKKYRDVEVLVIDDVQFCMGKPGTLIELRNTVDMLLRESRQVIFVSDRGLHELDGLGQDLYARLSGGMNCPIEPMDPQTRKSLLSRLCAQHALSIDQDVLSWVAEQCGSDARVIHGIVLRLLAKHRMLGRSLSAEEATSAISDIVRANRPIVRLQDIEQAVCKAFGLEQQKLQTKSKCQSLSQPRMLAMFLARKHTRTALSEIGEYFGNRKHSTVISAQKKVDSWIDVKESLQVGNTQMLVQDILRSLEASLQVG
jgi:chromosomal replication initiator protein